MASLVFKKVYRSTSLLDLICQMNQTLTAESLPTLLFTCKRSTTLIVVAGRLHVEEIPWDGRIGALGAKCIAREQKATVFFEQL